MVLCDIAREEASVLIEDLKELGIPRDGSIALEQIDSQLSDAAERAERAARGAPSDAVVWEEVEARTSESTELGGNFLVFMVARLPDRLGRDLHRLADPDRRRDGRRARSSGRSPASAWPSVERRRGVALRSLTALAVGFPVGITAAFLFTLICVATGLVDSDFKSIDNPLTQFIAEPDAFSFIVAAFAGAAGVLSLTSAKSGALVGVLISVTTIPAAANIGVAAALGNWDDWRRRDGAAGAQPERDRARRRRHALRRSAGSSSAAGASRRRRSATRRLGSRARPPAAILLAPSRSAADRGAAGRASLGVALGSASLLAATCWLLPSSASSSSARASGRAASSP